MEKRKVRLWEMDTYSDFSMPLEEFISMLTKIQNENASTEAASIKFERTTGYYDESDSFDVWVERGETDGECYVRESKEEKERQDRIERAKAEQAYRERATYEMLKAKFEGGG